MGFPSGHVDCTNLPDHFVIVIMICFSSTKYSLLVNGNPSDIFQPKRALRQGDPLSPLLFVIGMEYLFRLLVVLGGNKQFSFHPRCRKLKINHLCVVDDLMLFCKGDSMSTKLLCQCLETFSKSSSLQANLAKCVDYFAGIPKPLR